MPTQQAKFASSQRPQGLIKRSLAVLVMLSLMPGACFALGLGELKHFSHLGEKLEAQIDLINIPTDLRAENMRLRQLSGEEAEELGVEIVARWNPLEFRVDTSRDSYQISLLSRRPVREPFLNIMVELEWPTGKLYKEYTIFLDPAPLHNSAAKSPQPGSVVKHNKTTITKTLTTASQPTVGKTYTVAPGDTLGGIARRIRLQEGGYEGRWEDRVYESNPQAFINNNRNQLLAGAQLALPVELRPKTAQKQGLLTLVTPGAAATPANPVKQQIHANQLQIDRLVAENRDLKDRLHRLENSQYISTLNATLELQKQMIAQLQQQLGKHERSATLQKQVLQQAPVQYAAASIGLGEARSEHDNKFWAMTVSGILLALLCLYSLSRIIAPKLAFAASKSAQGYAADEPLQGLDAVLVGASRRSTAERKSKQATTSDRCEEEQKKDEILQNNIKQKVGHYQQGKRSNTNDMQVHEEIEIDPELEDYLKL